jgi:prepilin-type N-terminal cleavage/methylation domain-containing protein
MSGLRNSSGFTLVEIMVAIGILTIALLGLVSVTVMVIKGNSFSKTMTTATTLAKDKMEEMKNLGYSGTSSSDITTTEGYNSITNYPTYKRDTEIDVASPAAGMKTIEVKVEWSWQGTDRNVTLRTIVAE